MNRTLAEQIGSLVTDDSNWQPLNVLNNFTSGIPPSGNLQYSTWNSTPASSNYTYLRYNGGTSQFFSNEAKASLDSNFRPDIFSYAGSCTYPISGQYGFLNRLLFYLLMIFALVARRRTWLAAAALGTAMTYAASAAVHAFALLARYNYSSISFDNSSKAKDFGDLDLQGIFPILVASCIMLTPILNWSVEIREHARAIAVYWGLLMFTALVPTLVKVWQQIYPFTDSDQLFTCDVDVAKDCTLDYLNSQGLTFSSTFYNRCNCNDTCGAVSLPDAPFRHGQNLQAYVLSDRTQGLVDKSAVTRLFAINTSFLCFIIVHGILGLLEVNFTQAELRNGMFLLLAGNKAYSERASIGSKTRYYIAKSISLGFFVGAIVAAIICPAVYVSSVVINEINTWAYPVTERPDAIGQWGTYVGAAFVLIAAVIQRYHHAWLRLLELTFSETWRLIKGAASGKETNFRREPVQKARNDDNSVLENLRDFFIQCMRPMTHAGRSILHSWRRVYEEWEDYRLWLNDPIHRSQQPHYRRAEKPAYDMPPLPNVSKYFKRSATTPIMPSELPPQMLKEPTVLVSPTRDTSNSPRLPPNSRIAFPQPVAGAHNSSDEPALAQDIIPKQTSQRRASGQ